MSLRRATLAGLVLAISVGAWSSGAGVPAAQATLPDRLSDRDFWRLVEGFSESNGYFRSDNLVSNEETFQFVIPRLKAVVAPGGVYMGVGPDQNFTYLAALRPSVAFITDVRRGNLQAHLMYKAIFELSEDRAAFLSMLFSRPRPEDAGPGWTAAELFAGFGTARPDEAAYRRNLEAILDHLTVSHGFDLRDEDRAGIEYVYSHFFLRGPNLTYSTGFRGRRYPTYQDLQLADDARGTNHSYMANAGNYQFLRSFQERNLVVPIVGDFAGAKALRSVGGWVRERGAVVTTFYSSNVEQYLFQDGIWQTFVENLGSLPIDETSTLIRSCFNNCSSSGYRSLSLLDPLPALLRDAADGKIRIYWDVLSRSR